VNVPEVQPPAPLPLTMVEEVQLTVTAEVGTVLQPVKFEVVVPTFKVQGSPADEPVTLQETVAVELPVMALVLPLPGLFAAKVMVAGVALMLLTVPTKGMGAMGRFPEGMIGVGWRGFPGF
jgi:hypothetical protein